MAAARARMVLALAIIFSVAMASADANGRTIRSINGHLSLAANAVWRLSESVYVSDLTVENPAGIVSDEPVFVFYTRASENISAAPSMNVHGELAVGNVTYVPIWQLITIENETLEADFVGEENYGSLIVLKNATLTGRLQGVSLSMDDTSIWNVTGDSRLIGADFNRADLDRVFGDGHQVMFDGEVALSADFREFPEELNGEDKAMEKDGGNILQPVLPVNVEAMITSPHYVDGQSTEYGGLVTLTEDVLVSSIEDPVNNSAIYVKNGGKVAVKGNADIPLVIDHTSRTHTVYADGTDRSKDALMKMGVGSIVYANADGEINLENFRITGTTNGLYAIYGGVIRATGGHLETSGLHGVQVCFGGKISLKDVAVHTTGPQGSVLSSDFGGGWVVADNVTGSSQTTGSAGIYADGYSYFYVRNSDLTAHNDSAAVLCAGGEITLVDTVLRSGGTSRSGEVNAVIYVHPNGNNPRRVSNGYFTDCRFIGEGDVFNVDGKSTHILLKGRNTTIKIPEGARLISANNIAPGARTLDQAWPLDNNESTFTLEDVLLSGDIYAAPDGTRVSLALKSSTEYTGTITRAAVSIEDGSTWTLTGDSFVTAVDFNAMHIQSSGHDIYYDAGLAANAHLNKKQYDLSGGGTLLPVNVVRIENSEITADHLSGMYPGNTMLVLSNTRLIGELRGVSLAMDANSTWNITGNSSLVRAELQNHVVITDGSMYTGTIRGSDLTVADGGHWRVTEDASVVTLTVENGATIASDIYAKVTYGASETVTPGNRNNVVFELDESLLPPTPAMGMEPPGGGSGSEGPTEGAPGF